jgi:hypothetical protein
MWRVIGFILVGGCIAGFPAAGQTNPDTIFVANARKATIALYQRALQHESRLFNGSEYKEYQSPTDEHPYLFEDWRMGSVVYQGALFQEVPLLYDLSTGSLITETSGHMVIKLVSEHVSSFRIDNRLFEFISATSLPAGFYEVVYDSLTKVVAWRKRSLQQRNTVSGIERRFDERVDFYLMKDGRFFPVKNRRAVLQALADKKALLKKVRLIKPFSSYRLENIRLMAQAYDSLRP